MHVAQNEQIGHDDIYDYIFYIILHPVSSPPTKISKQVTTKLSVLFDSSKLSLGTFTPNLELIALCSTQILVKIYKIFPLILGSLIISMTTIYNLTFYFLVLKELRPL